MPVSFKLVGYIINKKYYEVKDPYHGDITLQHIHSLFINWGITQEEIEQVKFIIDSEQIRDPTKIYNIKPEETSNIFIFVFNPDIKQKLQIIFNTHGTEMLQQTNETESEEEISQPITQIIPETLPVLTQTDIINMNKQTLILFSDPDFITLLDIYKRKPELFNLLSNYIQNNNIIVGSLVKDKTIDQITDQEKEYYTMLSIKLIDFGFNIPQDVIINKLIKYSGHLNLTIRSLLNEVE